MKKYRHRHLKHKIKSLKPKKSIFKRRWFWVLALLVFLLAVIFYMIFFIPAFQVQKVQVFGNEKTESQQIQNSIWQNINKKILGLNVKNIFLVNSNTLKENVLANFSGIENVKIKKQWFDGLRLEITERKPVAVFCQDSNCFLIDKKGIIYQPANDGFGDRFIVRQNDGVDLALGQTVIDQHIMEALIKIEQTLKDNFELGIREAVSSNPLVVTTTEGWKLYFDPNSDISLQITKMEALLQNQISTSTRKNLNYIYLQYKDRAYYK